MRNTTDLALAFDAVLQHPWFAVTGADGSFELPPLSPGRYTLQIEHRAAGRSTQEFTVPATGLLTLTLPADSTAKGL